MAINKNQHFVPKTHLRQFSTDANRRMINVWLPKHNKIIYGASIKDQCSKSYIYGKDLEVEELFQHPEGILGKIITELNESQRPERETLTQLLFLWLLQHIRSERALTENVLLMAAMRDMIMLGDKGSEELKQWMGPATGTEEAIKITLESTREIFSAIADLKCVLLINNTKNGFAMSDNPAVSSNKLVIMRYPKYRSWGLGGAGLYIYMPLSPRIGFFAYDKHVYALSGIAKNLCNLNESDVKHLNQLVYLLSNHAVVLPPFGDVEDIIRSLSKVKAFKPENTARVNFAIEDESQQHPGHKRFSVASMGEVEKQKRNTLLHFETTPPIFKSHFPKLKIKTRAMFIDTNSGAGLKRYVPPHQVYQDHFQRTTSFRAS